MPKDGVLRVLEQMQVRGMASARASPELPFDTAMRLIRFAEFDTPLPSAKNSPNLDRWQEASRFRHPNVLGCPPLVLPPGTACTKAMTSQKQRRNGATNPTVLFQVGLPHDFTKSWGGLEILSEAQATSSNEYV